MRTHTYTHDIERIEIVDRIDAIDTTRRTYKLYSRCGGVFVFEAAASVASELDQQIRLAVRERGGSETS
jgi:hypothetical protein